MKMPEVLYIQKDCMELDSGLTEREFAHARLAQYMSEAGVLCIPKTARVVGARKNSALQEHVWTAKVKRCIYALRLLTERLS